MRSIGSFVANYDVERGEDSEQLIAWNELLENTDMRGMVIGDPNFAGLVVFNQLGLCHARLLYHPAPENAALQAQIGRHDMVSRFKRRLVDIVAGKTSAIIRVADQRIDAVGTAADIQNIRLPDGAAIVKIDRLRAVAVGAHFRRQRGGCAAVKALALMVIAGVKKITGWLVHGVSRFAGAYNTPQRRENKVAQSAYAFLPDAANTVALRYC